MTDLTAITLAKGSHKDEEDCGDPQRCLFEWFNWITRQEHTDACPPGVSPVLHVYGMGLNDALGDDRRQELRRYLPNGTSPLAGTAGDGKDETRSYIALDWLIRTYTPAWLDLAGLTTEAAALRELRRVADSASAKASGPVVRDAGSKAAAAWAAARAATRDATWAATRAAAGAATGAAARAAAWDATRAATWAATRAAAGAATGAAARAAAWDATGAATWLATGAATGDAARAAAWDATGAAARAATWAATWAAAEAAAGAATRDAAGNAAGAAAWDVLAPTVASLQDSAIALYDVLIAGVWPAEVTP